MLILNFFLLKMQYICRKYLLHFSQMPIRSKKNLQNIRIKHFTNVAYGFEGFTISLTNRMVYKIVEFKLFVK